MKINELIKAMKCIANYIEKKKPKNLEEAEAMLARISVIAGEATFEAEAAEPA